MSTIAAGGVVEPDRIVKTMLESVSKITSRMPISHANETATSKDFASASKGPKGGCMCWLRAAMTAPSWSRMIAPMPTVLRSLKRAASVLILNHGYEGGTQRASDGLVSWGRLKWAAWKSSRVVRARDGPRYKAKGARAPPGPKKKIF